MVLFSHVSLFIVYVGIALFFFFYRPKSINAIFGYRTRLSMKNEATWREANDFSSKIFLVLAASNFVFQIVAYAWIEGIYSFRISCGYLTVVSILIIPITEIHLLSIFTRDGKFKEKDLVKK